jgi:hypothetical protein
MNSSKDPGRWVGLTTPTTPRQLANTISYPPRTFRKQLTVAKTMHATADAKFIGPNPLGKPSSG